MRVTKLSKALEAKRGCEWMIASIDAQFSGTHRNPQGVVLPAVTEGAHFDRITKLRALEVRRLARANKVIAEWEGN